MKKSINGHVNVGSDRDMPQGSGKNNKKIGNKGATQSGNSASKKKVTNIHRQ